MNRLLEKFDALLNGVTMYRATLYALMAIWIVALGESAAGVLPFGPVEMVASLAFLGAVAFLTNAVFARIFRVPSNAESVYITVLILALIISPPDAFDFAAYLPLGAWAAVLAMASKYIVAFRHKHLFNPAAFAVLLTALALDQTASWWVGTAWLAAPTLLAGLFVARKLRRLDLVCTFLVVTTVLSLAFGLGDGRSIAAVLDNTLLAAPALFFALFMVTEPLTAPPGRNARLAYAALVAVLYTPAVHIGELYFTPELALVLGNALAFVLSPKARLVLTLQARREIGAGQQELVFTADQPLRFRPGQFLEWTLGHGTPDQRGIRRYFTIASSPAEPVVRVGVKVPASKPSSFKTALAALRPGDRILASQLAGDFVLPDDPTVKLAFIAGGIGVTPFRAMLQYLMEQQEKRDIALLYSNNTPAEIAYRDTLAAAGETLGVRTIHTITVPEAVPPDWNGARGFIDARMIREQVPDFADRVFYVSGPQAMVSATVRALRELLVPRRNIRTDYFPGLA